MVPGRKIPLREGWQDSATTDPAAISSWFSESPYINYGIRTGLVNNIVLIDLDGEEARQWWKDQGFEDSSAMVYSPRKDGGVHHYFRVYDIEVANSKSKLGPGVDVRGEGGLVVGPGSRTPEGMYVGDISNIPDAPQALLDILPEKQSYQRHDPSEFEGVEKALEPTESELADIEHIRNWLLALPREWAEGAGWHDTVFRSCCWLWRMIRTPSYALTESEGVDLMLNFTPTYPDWGDDEILKQWDSARGQTEGEYADPPAEALPEILDFVESVNLLPAFAPISGRSFFDVVGDETAHPSKLIDECLTSGLDVQQTASVIYGAKAGERYRQNEYGLRKLYREVEAAAAKIAAPSATSTQLSVEVDTTPAEPLAKLERAEMPDVAEHARLLTTAERESIAGARWWGTDYLEWAKSLVSAFNAPYHRMNRWTILSLILSTVGVIPTRDGEMGLNLFCFVLGETTTGKSESRRIMNSVLRTYFSEEDDPDIGGNPSPSALSEKLIERDGKASLFNKDEAHGQIAEMKVKDYLTNLMEGLTDLYDGEVPKMLRTTNREASDRRAKTFFSIHYMGTFDGAADVLEPTDWASGFLPRFIWAIGDKQEITRETLRMQIRKPGEGRAVDVRAMQKQWAAQFRSITNRIAPNGPVDMEIDDVVLERHTSLSERLVEIANGLPLMRERLLPGAVRLSRSVMKAACLVALSDGRTRVSLQDLLIAIEQAEEWLANLLKMVTATDSSPFVRKVDELERIIQESGGEKRMDNVYRRSPLETKGGTDSLVAQLVAEGRAKKELLADGQTQILKLIGDIS